MTIWPIERTWTLLGKNGEGKTCRSAELCELPVVCLLGAAGLGKTFEMDTMTALERGIGRGIAAGRLAQLGFRENGLRAALNQIATTAGADTSIYLDALDEAMVPFPQASMIVAEWIREKLSTAKPRLRISCRSAVWPRQILTALQEVYGENAVQTAILEPLDDEAVRAAARAASIDGEVFLQAVTEAGAESLARHPLTLGLLVRTYRADGVTRNRNELFRLGVAQLAQERDERHADGLEGPVPPTEILHVAEQLACFTLLSGREVIDLGDQPAEDSLGLAEITSFPSPNGMLTAQRIRAVAASGLCDGMGDRRFRFQHRQFAEYLAGRTLARLLPHQARSLLESGLGWQHGVAGPLRETAAFAANEKHEIAEWISETDPAVIGLSGVANDAVRRRALQSLFEKFRRHQLTDSQIRTGRSEFSGLFYSGVAQDLRPMLRKRDPAQKDLLDFVVEMAREWHLSEVSEELADLLLDPAAPEGARVAAGYALEKVGTDAAKRRTLALLEPGVVDPEWQYRGFALLCNWPSRLSAEQMLGHLRPEPSEKIAGAYDGFLHRLDEQRFDAAGARVTGLAWAEAVYGQGEDYLPSVRLARRIFRAALGELEQPEILARLATALITITKRHARSPFGKVETRYLRDEESPERGLPLQGHRETRRRLVAAMLADPAADEHLWWAAHETPHLLEQEDFPWLLERATDDTTPMSVRKHAAEIARTLPWREDLRSVEAWLKLREREPIRSILHEPLSMEIESEEGRRAKAQWQEFQKKRSPRAKAPLAPPPSKRVEVLLERCETRDPGFFRRLSLEITLVPESERYDFVRFLTNSAGWKAASPETRARIVTAAKRFLDECDDTTAAADREPLNTILTCGMAAIWLVESQDPQWLAARSDAWWAERAWFILREIRSNMVGETDESKYPILEAVRSRAPAEVRGRLVRLARGEIPDSLSTMQSLLRLLIDTADTELDRLLIADINANRVAGDRLREVAAFALRRSAPTACRVCLDRFRAVAGDSANSADGPAASLGVALLQHGDWESWDAVVELLAMQMPLCRTVLAEYAHAERYRHLDSKVETEVMTSTRMGTLTRLLFIAFPPNTDPDHEGAYYVGPEDSARDLRNNMLTHLGDRGDTEAVATLRALEAEFGKENPWLRRPRARAEQNLRRTRWTPIPPEHVAKILVSNENRLVRSPQDVLDGIVDALSRYERSLRNGNPSPIGALWNTPKGQSASPKTEEECSDVLCRVIQDYFDERAVTATREARVNLRRVPRADKGEPSSEVDILVTVPRVGTECGALHTIPIEVKLSGNKDAKTSLNDQLVDRYVLQTGAEAAAFVVLWMTAPNMSNVPKPQWKSIGDAQSDLQAQATAVSAPGRLQVTAMVLDCSLRSAN